MLFRKRTAKACGHCVHAAKIDDEQMLCCKKGLRSPTDKCSKFLYDPCKRIPTKAKPIDFQQFDKQDYSL